MFTNSLAGIFQPHNLYINRCLVIKGLFPDDLCIQIPHDKATAKEEYKASHNPFDLKFKQSYAIAISNARIC